jgi:hypothetical protein
MKQPLAVQHLIRRNLATWVKEDKVIGDMSDKNRQRLVRNVLGVDPVDWPKMGVNHDPKDGINHEDPAHQKSRGGYLGIDTRPLIEIIKREIPEFEDWKFIAKESPTLPTSSIAIIQARQPDDELEFRMTATLRYEDMRNGNKGWQFRLDLTALGSEYSGKSLYDKHSIPAKQLKAALYDVRRAAWNYLMGTEL